MNDEEGPFDIIIVGAGPSAAGLLRGLLQRAASSLVNDEDDIRIAILERGGGGKDTNDDGDGGGGKEERCGRFDHPHPSTRCLSRWFEASHYSSATTEYVVRRDDECDDADGDATTESPTVLHATVPNRSTNYRVMDVPTGRGWGGSTNVHAGLVVEPNWSTSSSSGGEGMSEEEEEEDDDDDGDFDARCWPGRWRGGEAMRRAVREVRSALVVEEEEGHVAPPCCDDGRLGVFDFEFRPVVTSSSSSSSSSSLDSQVAKRTDDTNGMMEEAGGDDENETTSRSRRVNYFAAIVEPMLRSHPTLEDRVTFMSGTRAERIMFDRYGRAWGVECLVPTHDHHSRHRGWGDTMTASSYDADSRCRPRRHCQRRRRTDDPCNRIVVRSRGEIVLCAGAIGSPALLLASGVGHEDDLRDAGIVPWYDRHTTQSEVDAPSPSSFHRRLPVGRNLRDHVLLPRVFLIDSRPCLRPWIHSRNSIQGTTTIDLPANAVARGMLSTTTRDRRERRRDRARIQLQLADGGQMDHMMPHFAAAAIRRVSRPSRPFWSSLTVDDRREMSSSAHWERSYYYPLRSLLRSMIRRSPFRNAARQRTAAINVCLMNPRSKGRVAVVRRRNNDDDVNDEEEVRKRKGQSSDLNAVPSRESHVRSTPTRLSDCRVIIDPGYLTDPWDADALWAGFGASSEIKRHWFGGCTEILPGRLLAIVFALVSFASSLIGWLMSHFWHGMLVGGKRSSVCMCDRPSWFSVYVAEFANPFYHWCGSCAMGEEVADGSDATGKQGSKTTGRDGSSFVVDERLCVRGNAGLRICDASVFPACISAPTALTCAALGYAASAFILDSDREIGQVSFAEAISAQKNCKKRIT